VADSRFKIENFIGLPTVVFTFLLLLVALFTILQGWLGFDMERFRDVEPYILTSKKAETATGPEAETYEQYAHPKAMAAAVEYYRSAHSNDATCASMETELRRVARFHDTLTKVYSEIEKYNVHAAIIAMAIIVSSLSMLSWQQWRIKSTDAVIEQITASFGQHLKSVGKEISKQILDRIPDTATEKSTDLATDALAGSKDLPKTRSARNKGRPASG
jgi:hypothetical protein